MIGIIALSAWIAVTFVALCKMEDEDCDFCEEEGEETWEDEQ